MCLTLAVLFWRAGPVFPADAIIPATDAPKPLAPEESRRSFQVPKGFAVELVASEPLLAEPTGLCFDARGRLFVCELHGYNRDGYYDIIELNKRGVLDKAVRRIPATKEAEQRAAKETYGTIKLLESSKGDGRFDRATVFADFLPPCYGVIPAEDGVIAICAPSIVFLADRDGDGKAEVREELFSGFGIGELWTRISNPRWGLDNWIYAAAGATSGGTIRGPHLKKEVKLGNTCFRFKPDGSQLEPVSGGSAGFGLAFDDWGDRFLVTNQQHALFVAPLPFQAQARNPFAAAVNPIKNICTYGHPAKLFPTSKPDPWRRRRGEQPEWVKFYGAAETSAGLFTSACAPTIYQADLFPEEYRGNHYSCEPAQNLIHRCVLEPKGAGYTVRRAEEGKEFLTTTDNWFRPVNLAVGPEGALYVVDMYREIIEDYSALPRYLQQQYVEGLRNGFDKGRIWRIVPDQPRKDPARQLAEVENNALVAELASPNVWRRLTAQRLLVERAATQAAPDLKAMATQAKSPQARLHALHALDGLKALTPELVRLALADAHFAVRVHALQMGERWLDPEPALFDKAVAMTNDPHPKVRLQLAFSLGESKKRRALTALAILARKDGDDPWTQTAILSSALGRSGRLIALLLYADADWRPSGGLLKSLAAVVGARGDTEEIHDLLQNAASLTKPDQSGSLVQLLTGLVEGLERGKSVKVAFQQRTLETLLRHPHRQVHVLALRVAGILNWNHLPAVQSVRRNAVNLALDEKRPTADRKAALDFMRGAAATDLESLQPLISGREPLDLQLAAVRVLAASDDSAIVGVLLKQWDGHSPRVQAAIAEVLCSRTRWLPLLLDAIEHKRLDASSLPSRQQTLLQENPDAAIRARAKRLLAAAISNDDRKRIIERYQASLRLKPDLMRGKEVFEQQCLKCHQLKGAGFAVGPDLAAVQNRPDESLLIDILDPSSTITVGYKTYQVITNNGKVYSGTLAEETATSITLRREKGEQDVILRKDIDTMVASHKSLMPDGLEKEISPQDMANLMGYLRESLRSTPSTR
jgi:putative membrane-bound dehydrogenase-like protein